LRKIELTLEEKLALENLRLKIQMAELQKHSASQQLGTYTNSLVRKYEVPEGSTVSMTETHIVVTEDADKPPAEPE
jgi:hypothetical protein